MKKIITALYIGALAMNVLAVVAAPSAVLAQTACSGSANGICNPLQATDVTALLKNIVNIAVPIGAAIAVIMFIIVGFKFIFAQGKPDKISEAWSWFAWVAVGTAILIGATAIVAIMESTLTSAGLVKQGLLPNS